MTDPTQEPRKSIEQLASEHPAPKAAWVVAAALMGLGLYKLAAEGTADGKAHLSVHVGTLVGGVLCVPGLAPWLAGNVRVFGGALADVASKLAAFLPWGKK